MMWTKSAGVGDGGCSKFQYLSLHAKMVEGWRAAMSNRRRQLQRISSTSWERATQNGFASGQNHFWSVGERTVRKADRRRSVADGTFGSGGAWAALIRAWNSASKPSSRVPGGTPRIESHPIADSTAVIASDRRAVRWNA